MLNEVQKNIRTGNYVRFALFALVMTGLVFLIIGVRGFTVNLPQPEDKAFAPRLTNPPTISVTKPAESQPEKPQKMGFVLDGERVEGTVTNPKAR